MSVGGFLAWGCVFVLAFLSTGCLGCRQWTAPWGFVQSSVQSGEPRGPGSNFWDSRVRALAPACAGRVSFVRNFPGFDMRMAAKLWMDFRLLSWEDGLCSCTRGPPRASGVGSPRRGRCVHAPGRGRALVPSPLATWADKSGPVCGSPGLGVCGLWGARHWGLEEEEAVDRPRRVTRTDRSGVSGVLP